MFKRDIKKYKDFQSYILRQKFLSQIDTTLSQFNEDINNYSIQQLNESIFISKEPLENLFHIPTQSNLQESLVKYENDEEILIEEEVSQVVEEEYIDDPDMQEQYNYEQQNFKSEEIIELEHVEMNEKSFPLSSPISAYREVKKEWCKESESSPKRRKKYVYKTNTNDSLSEEQLKWIKSQVRKSETIVDGKKVYKCQICGQILQIPGSLKKHLRDCHILKSQNEQEEQNSKQAFKNEVARSKIDVDTGEGVETIWKCQRCSHDRVFRSEAGLKVHLRYSHIRNQHIDVQFIAKCKITIKTENGLKNGWKCPDCEKILRSRDGLRNHMKLEHTELNESDNNTPQALSSEHFDAVSLLQLARKKQMPNSLHTTTCEPCGISFINGTTKKEKSLEIHQQLHIILKIVSKSYDLPRCEECKIMFSNNEDLNLHSLSHDDEAFPAEGLSFLVAERIKEPLGTAGDEDLNAWKCGHCSNVRFADEIECIEHQAILHSKNLVCPFDYLEFSGIRGLGLFSSHMKNKHPEMFPELSIICTYCNQEFSNVFDKLSHMKTCSEKKYNCDHCPKTFFKKTQLIRHLKIVSGAINFVCDICSKVNLIYLIIIKRVENYH